MKPVQPEPVFRVTLTRSPGLSDDEIARRLWAAYDVILNHRSNRRPLPDEPPKAPEALQELWQQLASRLKDAPEVESFRRADVQRWLDLKASRADDVLHHGLISGHLTALPRHRYRYNNDRFSGDH